MPQGILDLSDVEVQFVIDTINKYPNILVADSRIA